MDEITRLKAKLAKQVEDGRKVAAFTGTPEWQWFVDHVLVPTIQENTNRIIEGKIPTNKEDWITRGIIQGLQMVIDGADGVRASAQEAKKKAKELGGIDE